MFTTRPIFCSLAFILSAVCFLVSVAQGQDVDVSSNPITGYGVYNDPLTKTGNWGISGTGTITFTNTVNFSAILQQNATGKDLRFDGAGNWIRWFCNDGMIDGDGVGTVYFQGSSTSSIEDMYSGYNTGSGTARIVLKDDTVVNVTGKVFVGQGAKGELVLDDNAKLTVANLLHVGNDKSANGATGKLTVNDGTLTANNEIRIGNAVAGEFLQTGGNVIANHRVNIGSNGAGTGTLTIGGGTFLVAGNEYLATGANAAATINIGGSVGIATLNVTANQGTWLGTWAGQTTMNIYENGIFTTNKQVVIGQAAASTIHIQGGTFESTGQISFGAYSAGNGTLKMSAGEIKLGANIVKDPAATTAAIILEGGTVTSTAASNWATGIPVTLTNTTTFNTAGGNITINGDTTGGGNVTKTGANTLKFAGNAALGAVVNDAGTLEFSGGDTTISGVTTVRRDGEFILSGGNVTTTGNFCIAHHNNSGVNDTGNGTLTITGGTLTVGGVFLATGQYGDAVIDISGTGKLNVTSSDGSWLSTGAGRNTTLNLSDGGQFITSKNVNKGGGGNVTVNFGGGTVVSTGGHSWAAGMTVNFLAGTDTVFDTSGGLINFNSATNGTGNLVKTGGNDLNFSAATKLGKLTVDGGTVNFSGSSSFDGELIINDGTVIANCGNLANGISSIAPGSDITVGADGTLTLNAVNVFGWGAGNPSALKIHEGTVNSTANGVITVGEIEMESGILSGNAGTSTHYMLDGDVHVLADTAGSSQITARQLNFRNTWGGVYTGGGFNVDPGGSLIVSSALVRNAPATDTEAKLRKFGLGEMTVTGNNADLPLFVEGGTFIRSAGATTGAITVSGDTDQYATYELAGTGAISNSTLTVGATGDGTFRSTATSPVNLAFTDMAVGTGAGQGIFELHSEKFTLGGDYTQGENGVLHLSVTLDDATRTLSSSLLSVEGDLTLGGTLWLTLEGDDAWTPDLVGESVSIMDYNGILAGAFSSIVVDGRGMASDMVWLFEAGNGVGILSIGVPEPATWLMLISGFFGLFAMQRKWHGNRIRVRK